MSARAAASTCCAADQAARTRYHDQPTRFRRRVLSLTPTRLLSCDKHSSGNPLSQLICDANNTRLFPISMTALVARQPLHPLSMSSTQRPPRRLSARLQDHNAGEALTYTPHQAAPSKGTSTSNDAAPTKGTQTNNNKKRKNSQSHRSLRTLTSDTRLTTLTGYDEEDDGFAFTRVKKKQQKQQPEESQRPEPTRDARKVQQQPAAHDGGEARKMVTKNGNTVEPVKKRQKRMSFSTPKTKPNQTVRRSKRISAEHEQQSTNPLPKTTTKDELPQYPSESATQLSPQKATKAVSAPHPELQQDASAESDPLDRAATKISLPFADTPIIRRNKAMRENKSGRGERRSSLGLRGRRASSLIESGSSNGKSAI